MTVARRLLHAPVAVTLDNLNVHLSRKLHVRTCDHPDWLAAIQLTACAADPH